MTKNAQDAPEGKEPELVLCIPSHREEAERLLALSKAEPDSPAIPIHRDQTQDAQAIGADVHPNTLQATTTPETGDVHPSRPVEPPAAVDSRTHAREITKRLQREGRWKGQAEQARDDMMADCKDQFGSKEAAQQWVYSELDRMYPPKAEIPIRIGNSDVSPLIPTKAISETASDTGQIQGLSDLPKGWPELPANASLSTEIGWVQANRLFMVTEAPGKATRVRLGKASTPAPSRAALGWLETSIRSYAKYVDVVAKASTGAEDEGAVMRRERRSVDEVRALLQEMQEAEGNCPSCGKPF